MSSIWELLDTNFGNVKIKRLRTPMGWLVRTDDGESILYLQDEENHWKTLVKLEFIPIPYSGQNTLLRRARIPGGWLLARYTNKTSTTYEGDVNRTKARSLEFVPDPKWEWEIPNIKTEN